MTYRTKTYIAGDWTGDSDAIQKLYEWKDNDWRTLDFVDAHELTQARDSSLNCSIKRSLKQRLDASKTFVLVVGKNTKDLRAGSCAYCGKYTSYYSTHHCSNGYSADMKSYIDYECEVVKAAGIKIVVLYNYANVDKSKCPEALRITGTHLNMFYYNSADGKYYWNYRAIKDVICD